MQSDVITRLGYVRSEYARQLRAGRSRIMSLLVLDMGNPFFVDIARGAERAARDAGLGVMVCNSGQSPTEEADYLAHFAEQRVRGVLVAPADPTGRRPRKFRRPRHPLRRWWTGSPGTRRGARCPSTTRWAARSPLRHLVAQGHRRIAFVSGPPRTARRSGPAHRRPPPCPRPGCRPTSCANCPPSAWTWPRAATPAPGLLGLADRPTAVFCANDLLALGVLQALYAAGVKVPEDMAIVGYDDIEFAAAATVPLTSVRQPAFTLGTIAAGLLLEETGPTARDHRHQHVVLQPELVVRQSSMGGHDG